MAAGITYSTIATQTLGSASQSLTFSSIPSTYTDLRLVIRSSMGGEIVAARFNSDSGSNYSCTNMYGTGSSLAQNRRSAFTEARLGIENFNTNSSGIVIVDFMNYANTSMFKTYISKSDYPSQETNIRTGLWKSTAAINTILISSFNASWPYAAGSTFTLYGITAA